MKEQEPQSKSNKKDIIDLYIFFFIFSTIMVRIAFRVIDIFEQYFWFYYMVQIAAYFVSHKIIQYILKKDPALEMWKQHHCIHCKCGNYQFDNFKKFINDIDDDYYRRERMGFYDINNKH